MTTWIVHERHNKTGYYLTYALLRSISSIKSQVSSSAPCFSYHYYYCYFFYIFYDIIYQVDSSAPYLYLNYNSVDLYHTYHTYLYIYHYSIQVSSSAPEFLNCFPIACVKFILRHELQVGSSAPCAIINVIITKIFVHTLLYKFYYFCKAILHNRDQCWVGSSAPYLRYRQWTYVEAAGFHRYSEEEDTIPQTIRDNPWESMISAGCHDNSDNNFNVAHSDNDHSNCFYYYTFSCYCQSHSYKWVNSSDPHNSNYVKLIKECSVVNFGIFSGSIIIILPHGQGESSSAPPTITHIYIYTYTYMYVYIYIHPSINDEKGRFSPRLPTAENDRQQLLNRTLERITARLQ